MTEVVTTRLSGKLLRRIDRLISEGHFHSRSEAFRVIVEGYLNDHPELLIGESLAGMLQEAPDLSDEELLKLGSILFKDGVAKLVAEGRGRMKGLYLDTSDSHKVCSKRSELLGCYPRR